MSKKNATRRALCSLCRIFFIKLVLWQQKEGQTIKIRTKVCRKLAAGHWNGINKSWKTELAAKNVFKSKLGKPDRFYLLLVIKFDYKHSWLSNNFT